MKNIKNHKIWFALGIAFLLVNSAFAQRQTFAIRVRDNSRIVLYTSHTSGISDPASTARQNIVDAANCQPSKTSGYSDVGVTTVWLHTGMLDAMGRLANTYGYSYRVTEVAGGDHSSTSRHYSGLGFDVNQIHGIAVSSSNPHVSAFKQRCRDMGATEVLGPGDAGHSTHIHAAWPRNTSGSNPGGCNFVVPVNNRIGLARTPSGQGYWIAGSDGGVFSFGDANFFGSMGGQPLNSPVVAICARPQGDGYWLVAADGGIFSFGGAPFRGSMGGQPLNQPIVGMACTADGNGYWLVAKDGGIFSFNAPFHGSWGGQGLTDFAGIAATPANAYWLVRATGSIYTFGPAGYHGGGEALSGVKSIISNSDGSGYWQVRDNGAVFGYGNVCYNGGANEPGLFVGIARGPSNCGYWLLKKDGSIYSFGDAVFKGGANF